MKHMEMNMGCDNKTVQHKNVVAILKRIRHGNWQSHFAVLEDQEPVLAGFTLAAADTLAEKLKELGAPPGIALLVHTEMMVVQLLCIEAMRQASLELWRELLPGDQKPANKKLEN
jgi:hypothetical protein